MVRERIHFPSDDFVQYEYGRRCGQLRNALLVQCSGRSHWSQTLRCACHPELRPSYEVHHNTGLTIRLLPWWGCCPYSVLRRNWQSRSCWHWGRATPSAHVTTRTSPISATELARIVRTGHKDLVQYPNPRKKPSVTRGNVFVTRHELSTATN